MLSWTVRNASAVFIDGTDVTGLSALRVSPAVTTTYTLVATNSVASSAERVTVLVNPAPVIHRFTASRSYLVPGETVTLAWDTQLCSGVVSFTWGGGRDSANRRWRRFRQGPAHSVP